MALDDALAIDDERPLREMGLDSLMSVELRNALVVRAAARLPATLLFDHPTVAALARRARGRRARRPLPRAHRIARRARRARRRGALGAARRGAARLRRTALSDAKPLNDAIESQLRQAIVTIRALKREVEALRGERRPAIAVVGIGCRLPGGANDTQVAVEDADDGHDAIVEVPARALGCRRLVRRESRDPGRMNSRWGGFLDGIDRFDARLLRASRRARPRAWIRSNACCSSPRGRRSRMPASPRTGWRRAPPASSSASTAPSTTRWR
jgi:acyl carrier protein